MRTRLAAGLITATLLLAACQRPEPKTLTVAIGDDILSADPNSDVEALTELVLVNVFEPLVGFDEGLQIRGILAESWGNPSPERWRFRLRSGVRFHDGTPLTAESVKLTLERVRNGSSLEASNFMSHVVEVAIVDELTLDLVTREPRALLPNLPFVFISKPNTPGAFPPFLGTGPYRLREWTRDERVVLERRQDAAGTTAGPDLATFVPVRDPRERLARVAKGEADIGYDIPPDLSVAPDSGVRLVRHPGLTSFYLGLNVRRTPGNPLADVRVRRAMSLALDRQRLVDSVLKGAARPLVQPVSPSVVGFAPGLPGPAPPDRERARALLAEAGYARGFATRLDLGASRLTVGRALRDDLNAIGIEVVLNPVPGNEVYELAEAGKSDLFFVGWGVTSGVASEFFEFCLHTRTERFGFNNYGGYSNARLDAIAETNGTVLDQRARRELLEEAARIAFEELPILPLYAADDVYAVREDLEFTLRHDSLIFLQDVRPRGGARKRPD